jgi:hypothetical protein
VRLLVNRGADSDHLSTFCWTALPYLWFHRVETPGSSLYPSNLDFLKLFMTSSVAFDLSVRDVLGLTVLQRAVAEGSPEEVQGILHLSDTPTDGQSGLGDPITDAIEHAVELGNFSIFSTLLSAYGDMDRPLENGWTL